MENIVFVQSLFPSKDKNIYPACKINHELCSCKENYIGESKRSMVTRWAEHDNSTHDSEPVKDLHKNIQHSQHWTILENAFKHAKTRKNLEAINAALVRTSLNDQLKPWKF